MSISSFLSKIWAEVKDLFSKLPSEVKLAASVAVTITDNIKKFVDSPAADILTAIIPGDLDDKIKAWLHLQLPNILTGLRLVEALSTSKDSNEITSAAIKIVQAMDGDIQSAFLHDLGVLIAQEVAKAQNETLSWSDGIYIIEWYYQHKFKDSDK
ncbi:hypothetical protein [Mucilaginibacter polytrichastri]|uniref:Uncharacterized protein n=1 Tax=Mucilaginibacter polytrichastri TaxID=1302689 RepID=A0A1Q5ZST9_9SPHI|nr:hypothetical protein [Mucilaginibacter polytrichastri]OKS84834.1 hypothetical protein RG47T_0271 [Mucilaginibacter polytrichastri]SFS48852.1 hypothetical protein SAMN04487890_101803 [Mucilaginibacter polytrichastri]